MMVYEPWVKKRVLVTARTYPVPSRSEIEVSCTAGITDDGHWIRLFPVPYRFLTPDQRFAKYQYIEAEFTKATSDPRPESFKVNVDSIEVVSPPIPPDNKWQSRKDKVLPFRFPSLCALQAARNRSGEPTLGFFKPKAITSLTIEETTAEWTEKELGKLRRYPLFGNAPKSELEKLPYTFKYEFRCDDADCHSHALSCTDWEMGAAYRSWKMKYGANWQSKFREKFEFEMIAERDTHFYVGTVHDHPDAWIIIGLFYPPK
ncbi:MAG: hypothetical protein HY671_09985 [Chloroflexi bacterium]|nr:hypothetical protein [Chloroflexota bacterium]